MVSLHEVVSGRLRLKRISKMFNMENTILANFISSILSSHFAKKLQAGRTEATTPLFGRLCKF